MDPPTSFKSLSTEDSLRASVLSMTHTGVWKSGSLGNRSNVDSTSYMTLGKYYDCFGSQPLSLKIKLEQLISKILLALEF